MDSLGDSLPEKQFKIVKIFLDLRPKKIKSFNLAENLRTLGYNAPEISFLKVHAVQEIL